MSESPNGTARQKNDQRLRADAFGETRRLGVRWKQNIRLLYHIEQKNERAMLQLKEVQKR